MTSQQTIRLFLVGLPAGLVISGIIAMLIYFRVERAQEEGSGMVVTRRPLSQDDLTARIVTLAGRIGERNTSRPVQLLEATRYLQSSLGPANVGFQVGQRKIPDSPQWANDEVELRGSGERRGEIVLVTANYDSAPGTRGANDNATGLAALMCLAESLAGTAHNRTLRFVATVNDEPPHAGTPAMGSLSYARFLQERGDNVVVVLALDSLAAANTAAGAEICANERAAEFSRSAMSAFAAAADIPVREAAPPPGGFPPDSGAWAFDQAGFPVVRLTGEQSDDSADSVDGIDFAQVFASTRGAEAVIREWLNPR